MKRRFLISAILLNCFLLIGIILPALTSAAAEERLPLLDAEEIQEMLDAYLEENGILSDLISVGYVYTATGETWYHNPDRWFYSASLYKVPLMMILAEREAAGDLSQESEIYGMPLSYIEEEVLTYSNNDIAYSVMLSIAQPDECRRLFQRYSAIPEENYPWEFASYSYFSARFMTDVMQTLFYESERFPHVTDCLLNAQPGHYFHLQLGDELLIAQKYGCYHDDWDDSDWNHTSGIIYTPNPFILTVMTRYGGMSENIIGDLAVLFYEYTLQMDNRLREQEIRMEAASPAAASSEPILTVFSRGKSR
ncbi:MAG: hypothetical protein IKS55_01450 [Oscillospiraceae bacterium]|nr:hypothetical protein [Oscillospiraceae bacterium]